MLFTFGVKYSVIIYSISQISETICILLIPFFLRKYGIKVVNELPAQKFDAAIAAVAHKKFDGMDVPSLLKEKHVIFDVKCTLDRSVVDGRL